MNGVFGPQKRTFRWKKVIVNKVSEERKLSIQRISRNLVLQKLVPDRRPLERYIGLVFIC